MWWWLTTAAAGIVVIAVLDRVIAKRKKDHMSSGWIAGHHTSEGHQDGWLVRRDR